WVEGLAAALFSVALALAWACRGGRMRAAWVAIVAGLFLVPAAALAWGAQLPASWPGAPVRTSWSSYTLGWLVAFLVLAVVVVRRGLHLAEGGHSRAGAAWPRGKLWLGLAGSALAFGFTLWNMDLSARADLAIARQEASAVLLALNPAPVPEAE